MSASPLEPDIWYNITVFQKRQNTFFDKKLFFLFTMALNNIGKLIMFLPEVSFATWG